MLCPFYSLFLYFYSMISSGKKKLSRSLRNQCYAILLFLRMYIFIPGYIYIYNVTIRSGYGKETTGTNDTF